VLRAPEDGVVIDSLQTGDIAFPGGQVMALRGTTQSTVTAWLPPADAARVCTGDHVQIGSDWANQRPGR